MKTESVFKTMHEITSKYITHYKDDFYKYDLNYIYENRPHEFVWLIRDTGTHLLSDVDCGKLLGERWFELYELYKRNNKRFYYVKLNADGSGEVTLSEKRCDEFAARMKKQGSKQ